MTNEIITGRDIMKRWGITAFQFQDVLREGELVAVQDDLIDRRTPESDPCLFCDGERELDTQLFFSAVREKVVFCKHALEMDIHQCAMAFQAACGYRPRQERIEMYHEWKKENPDAPSLATRHRCVSKWQEEHRGHRIEAARFLLFELEAYEKTSGMWHPGEEIGTASEKRVVQAKEDERQQILLDMALAHVREREARITNDELLEFLCRNSKEEVSVRAAKEVWKKLPLEMRKGAGRPKKEV